MSDYSMLHSFHVDRLQVKVYPDRMTMGQAAADAVADRMRRTLDHQERISMVFAAAPSQEEFLRTLSSKTGLDWQRVTAFHMDEYIGLPLSAPQRFGYFLRERLFRVVMPGSVHYLDVDGHNPSEEVPRYGKLLRETPPDIVCAGIGENGHLAFNDPPSADFEDPALVRIVALCEESRQQQVHDGCFSDIAQVPQSAITLTIPALFSALYLSCVVPSHTKAKAVRQMLMGPVSAVCPASILRRHPNAILYLDLEAASLIAELIDK